MPASCHSSLAKMFCNKQCTYNLNSMILLITILLKKKIVAELWNHKIVPKIFFAPSFCGKSDVTNQTSSKSSIFSWFRFLLLNSACSSTTLQQEEVCTYFFGSSVVHLLQASRQAHRRTISFNALFQINYLK